MNKTTKTRNAFLQFFIITFFTSMFHFTYAQSQNECISKEQFEEILSKNKHPLNSIKYQSEENVLLLKLVKMDRPCLFAKIKNTPNYTEKQIEQTIHKIITYPKDKNIHYVTDELYFLLKNHPKPAKTFSLFNPISSFSFD